MIGSRPDEPEGHGVRPALVILAAGLASRYGRLKQLDAVGPGGEALMDYAMYDAALAGFARVVLVVRAEIEAEVRQHVERVVGGAVPVSFVCQRLDDVRAGVSVPAGRQRPWGTVHAILAAEPAIAGPFAVCNADDFYGRGAYRRLYVHLTAAAERGSAAAALVGYPLRSTLSRWGGVSRAVCRVDEDGWLEQIVEVRQVREVGGRRSTVDDGQRIPSARQGGREPRAGTAAANDSGLRSEADPSDRRRSGADAAGAPRTRPAAAGRRLSGFDEGGAPMSLDGDVVVSMNLWGFTPAVFPAFRRQFAEFAGRHGGDPGAELGISTAVNEQIRADELRLRVLAADDEWFGMTFPEDRDDVARRIAERIARGEYPGRRLWCPG